MIAWTSSQSSGEVCHTPCQALSTIFILFDRDLIRPLGNYLLLSQHFFRDEANRNSFFFVFLFVAPADIGHQHAARVRRNNKINTIFGCLFRLAAITLFGMPFVFDIFTHSFTLVDVFGQNLYGALMITTAHTINVRIAKTINRNATNARRTTQLVYVSSNIYCWSMRRE